MWKLVKIFSLSSKPKLSNLPIRERLTVSLVMLLSVRVKAEVSQSTKLLCLLRAALWIIRKMNDSRSVCVSVHVFVPLGYGQADYSPLSPTYLPAPLTYPQNTNSFHTNTQTHLFDSNTVVFLSRLISAKLLNTSNLDT